MSPIAAAVALLLSTVSPSSGNTIERGALVAMCLVVEYGVRWPGGVTPLMIDRFSARVASTPAGETVCPL